jgi:hypothetical protein
MLYPWKTPFKRKDSSEGRGVFLEPDWPGQGRAGWNAPDPTPCASALVQLSADLPRGVRGGVDVDVGVTGLHLGDEVVQCRDPTRRLDVVLRERALGQRLSIVNDSGVLVLNSVTTTGPATPVPPTWMCAIVTSSMSSTSTSKLPVSPSTSTEALPEASVVTGSGRSAAPVRVASKAASSPGPMGSSSSSQAVQSDSVAARATVRIPWILKSAPMRLSLCFAVSAAWEESGLRFVLYLFDTRQFRGRAGSPISLSREQVILWQPNWHVSGQTLRLRSAS